MPGVLFHRFRATARVAREGGPSAFSDMIRAMLEARERIRPVVGWVGVVPALVLVLVLMMLVMIAS
jgi:hypothetical protein